VSVLTSEFVPPAPSPESECVPPPGIRGGGGGQQSLAGERSGRSQFGRLERKPGTLILRVSTTFLPHKNVL
jgi:hypothetical protein